MGIVPRCSMYSRGNVGKYSLHGAFAFGVWVRGPMSLGVPENPTDHWLVLKHKPVIIAKEVNQIKTYLSLGKSYLFHTPKDTLDKGL